MNGEVPDFPAYPLVQSLSTALARAAQSYRQFSEQDAGDAAKNFTAHHNACKAALAHIAAIVKLQETWQKQNGTSEANEDLETLLRHARDILLTNDNDDDPEENQF